MARQRGARRSAEDVEAANYGPRRSRPSHELCRSRAAGDVRWLGRDAPSGGEFRRYSINNQLLLWVQAEERGVTLNPEWPAAAPEVVGCMVIKEGIDPFGVYAQSRPAFSPIVRRLGQEGRTVRAPAESRVPHRYTSSTLAGRTHDAHEPPPSLAEWDHPGGKRAGSLVVWP